MATFVDPLRRAERVARRREALVCGDVRMTYAEFLARCRRLVGGLGQLGDPPWGSGGDPRSELGSVRRAVLLDPRQWARPSAVEHPLGRA